jgi:hypothetical protein
MKAMGIVKEALLVKLGATLAVPAGRQSAMPLCLLINYRKQQEDGPFSPTKNTAEQLLSTILGFFLTTSLDVAPESAILSTGKTCVDRKRWIIFNVFSVAQGLCFSERTDNLSWQVRLTYYLTSLII